MNHKLAIINQACGKLVSTGLLLGLSFGLVTLSSKPVRSAEKLKFNYEELSFSVSVASLKTYAETGEITPDLSIYAGFLPDKALLNLRGLLQRRFNFDQILVYRLSRMPIGETLLKNVGKAVTTHPKANGFYALRAALVLAAAKAEGWTVLDVMEQFPTDTIEIEGDFLFQLHRQLITLSDYHRSAIAAVQKQAVAEAELEANKINALPNLQESGNHKIVKETINFKRNTIRSTPDGLSSSYSFDVDFYFPQDTTQPAPLIVISHGFGALKENFTFLAQHLASHGYVVAVPEHIGSDLDYRQSMLQGKLSTALSPIEFLDRPRDISFLLDQLEKLVSKNTTWAKRVNLQQVGVAGDSLGATTALSLAGAEINTARLAQECEQEINMFNVSMLLQCRATYLPPVNYKLQDSRIQAAIAAHPLTSGIFGPEGMSQISIPTMIVAGSNDIVAPVIPEQIHAFTWMEAPTKYLALFVPGTHFTTSLQSNKGAEFIPPAILGTNANEGRRLYKGLSTAFFNVHLRQQSEYKSYLTAAYAQTLGNEKLNLELIQSLTPTQLQQAYAKNPPLEIVPKSLVVPSSTSEEDILQTIQNTGVVKVAIRRDAAPLGYLDKQGQWQGYCTDLLSSLADYLTKQLNLSSSVEVIELPSNVDNRFELVKNHTVALECGPNTIRKDIEGITFSDYFFLTGAQFFVKSHEISEIEAKLQSQDLSIGVIPNTTTEKLIEERYPKATIKYFSSPTATEQGITAVIEDEIDTFANDGILLLGESIRGNLEPEQYTLVPKLPLSCEFYGLILPENNSKWQDMVNSFLAQRRSQKDTLDSVALSEGSVLDLEQPQFNNVLANELSNLEYCFDLKQN